MKYQDRVESKSAIYGNSMRFSPDGYTFPSPRRLSVLATIPKTNNLPDALQVIGPTQHLNIDSLSDELLLIAPLPICVKQDKDGSYTAFCSIFEILGHGITKSNAINILKAALKADYESYLDPSPKLLTLKAKQVYDLYCAFLGKPNDLPFEVVVLNEETKAAMAEFDRPENLPVFNTTEELLADLMAD